MPTDMIKFAIDTFIEKDYICDKQAIYDLAENDSGGESLLRVVVQDDNICVMNYDKKKRCVFLNQDKKHGLGKCIDHFILTNKNGQWQLHMFEMKTTIGTKTWIEVKQKFRASYLNICALCAILGISVNETYAYTTYEIVKFDDMKSTTDLSTIKLLLGQKPPKKAIEEWEEGSVTVDLGYHKTFSHFKIKMEKVDNCLKNSINI